MKLHIFLASLCTLVVAGCAPREPFALKYPHPAIQPGVLAVSRADMERLDRYQGSTPFAMDVSCPAKGGFISREAGSDDIACGQPWHMAQDGTIWIKASDPTHLTAAQREALRVALDVKRARVQLGQL
jgi:hypothetical protein